MISKFFKNEETNIVNKLDNYPEEQLNYIINILKDREEGKRMFDNQILIKHISLLSRFKPEAIYPEISQWDYPIDECLKICKEKNILDATAFFYERSGALEKSLEVHKEMIKELLFKYIENTKILKASNLEENDESDNLFCKIDKQVIITNELCRK